MTQQDLHAAVAGWNEPEGLNPRGTVIILPGRGEHPAVYERFGRRIAADAYRVRAVASPAEDPALAEKQVRSLLDGPTPVVLAGSDTGALFAAALVASGQLPQAAALVLAGLPTEPSAGAADGHPADSETDDRRVAGEPAPATDAWLAELEARTACPTHRGKLAGDVLRRGALYEPVPAGWAEQADLRAVTVPVLGLHGAADPVSALSAARAKYAAAPHAELVSITGGRHDAFNDITHRTVAATVILFLERLRNGAGLAPIAVREPLGPQVGTA
jgi:pimeloyl-ACP methyl ester carboxylesterase